MALMARMLGGIGKGVIGTGGAVLKGGAKVFGDDAVEALGRGVGSLQKNIDDVVEYAVKQDQIYKEARNQARGIKEATKQTGEAAKDAVVRKPVNNYRKNTSFSYDGYTYRMQDGTYQRKAKNADAWENISSKEYGKTRGKFIGENEALEQAAINAESGAGFWSGLGEMVQDHPYIAAGIASGVGVAGGALLFGDDD